MTDRLFARIERLFDVDAFEDLWVLIAGCGSGGGQVAQHLVMSGVRNFILVDKGELEVENVIRHVCGLRYLGWRKTAALADVIRDRNPQVEVRMFDEDILLWRGLRDEVGRAGVVVVGTDNEPSRYRLNEVCVETGTPFTVGRVFTRGIGGEVYAYRPGECGCLACLERVLERTQYRDGVREIDLVSEEERQKVYDLEIEEIKDSPGLSIDIGFIAAFHTRFTLDALGDAAASRPQFMTPIHDNYLVWGNRAVHPFSRNFQVQRMRLSRRTDAWFAEEAMKERRKRPAVRVEIAGEVLESVFEECDRHDREETGGRVIGHFAMDGDSLVIQAGGVIEPGPNARRTRTSFFQDGDHQTEVFRRIEADDPSIEHLGNWHTHHVNGYPTLSGGDRATYRRIVNHELHNLDFFYALLVTHRNEGQRGLHRYAVRHYVLFRGDDAVYEIARADVKVTDDPGIRPKDPASTDAREDDAPQGDETLGTVSAAVRVRDQFVLGLLFPSLEPRRSTSTGTFFWKGQLRLIDGSAIDLKVAEVEDDGRLAYYPVLSPTSEQVAELCGTAFASAAHAVRALEVQMNREIYESAMAR